MALLRTRDGREVEHADDGVVLDRDEQHARSSSALRAIIAATCSGAGGASRANSTGSRSATIAAR